jgi:alginate O-acetyltransferase complex protein AlgI
MGHDITAIAANPVPSAISDSSAAQRKFAAPDLWRFCGLAAQLALLMAVFRLYHVEDLAFQTMANIVCGAFLVHYWLPFRWQEPFLAAVSIGGAFLLLHKPVPELLVAIGLLLFLFLRLPIRFRWRLVLVAGVLAVLIYGCATGRLPIPGPFYAVFGGIFIFRIVIYAYDVGYGEEPIELVPFLNYFFILPNYIFTLFPVIDYQTMRHTRYQRDTHQIAQQGIQWIARGVIQLCLYRLVFYFNDQYLPDRVTSLRSLVTNMVLTYLLYLNVSGRFHIAVGMLHLFGYDLPETNRKYLLANSFKDLWRRINIYWKDFMVKVFYYPVYFKLRKRGDFQAQMLATAAVFVASWLLHPYMSFWLIGRWTFSWVDTIFWAVLGALVMLTTLYERRRKKKPRLRGWQASGLHALQVLGTFTAMTILWSLWYSPDFRSWTYLMTHWMGGGR